MARGDVKRESGTMSAVKAIYDSVTLGRGKWYLAAVWVVVWAMPKAMSILGVQWCRALWDLDAYRALGIGLLGVVLVTLVGAYLRGA